VALGQDALEVRNLAHLPQQAHRLRVLREGHHLGVAHERGEGLLVLRAPHPDEEGMRRLAIQAAEEGEGREEVEVVRAPEEVGERGEAVLLHGLHQPRVQGAELRRRREVAVANVPARPARDLADLGRAERPRPHPVELREAGEDHVVDVEIQAHADGVGGHEVVHLPGLVEAHLGVAGARGEGPEDEGGPPRSRRRRAATS